MERIALRPEDMRGQAKIDISEFSDFCFGVKRAISLAEGALKKGKKPIFSLGPLIHNREVVRRLSSKGLNVAGRASCISKGTVVIRSHGVSRSVLAGLKRMGLDVIDATCPFVKNAQMLAMKLSKENYTVVIVGDKGHPEVKALKSFSGKNSFVIATKNEARILRLKGDRIGIIAQTTQSPENFFNVIEELLKKGATEIRAFDTICRDTDMRQKSARKRSRDNELVIIVGGKNSANTRRLYEICKNTGTQTYHVETGRDIKQQWLKDKKRIGVVSGASTPRWIVEGVVKRLQSI